MNPNCGFEPFTSIQGDLSKGIVLVADHAMNLLPQVYDGLGLPPQELERHIAYDIGIETLTRRLAARLNAPAVMAGFSRLLIDPNRGRDDPTLIRQVYDGTVIEANYPMTAQEHAFRISQFYEPYHAAVSDVIASCAEASGQAPFIVSLHSFTPCMKGRQRPWHVGVLWDRDDRAVLPLLAALEAQGDLTIGDNEPYNGALLGDTMYQHCTLKGYAHALIEVRQDLIATESGAEEWAARLAPILDEINQRADIHRIEQRGSRNDPSQ